MLIVRYALIGLVVIAMSGCSALQPNSPHLDLADLLTAAETKRPSGGPRADATASAIGDWGLSTQLQRSHQVETQWSPLELYGNKANAWVDEGSLASSLLLRPQQAARRWLPLKTSPVANGRRKATTESTELAGLPAAADCVAGEANLPALKPLRELEPAQEPLADRRRPVHLTIPAGIATLPFNPTAENPSPSGVVLATMAATPSSTGESTAQPALPPRGEPQGTTPATAPRLTIGTPCFCRAVRARGDCERVAEAMFHTGGRTLVYCEVSLPTPLHSDLTAHRSELQLAGSLLVKNEAGEVVYERKYAAESAAPSSDGQPLFVVLPWTIPHLPPGGYQLHVGVADVSQADAPLTAEPLAFQITATPSMASRSR